MSLTNFYQTLYQTEQLFRLDNDPFPVLTQPSVVVTETLLVDTEPTEPALGVLSDLNDLALPETAVDAPALPEAIADEPVSEPVIDPVISLPVEPEQPVILEAVPARTMPSTHRPNAPARPLLNHKVLILVDEELLPSDVLFLEKILNAINLNINGVDLLNVHGLDGIDFAPILADKVIHHFLTFGVPFQRLNLDILMDRYQPVRFHGITFMLADPLAAIEGDKNLKKRLWEALKRIFLMG